MGTNSEQDNLSPVKRALVSLRETQAKLDVLERSRKEPIAIIGLGCRFPGQADTPEAFWKVMRNGQDTIREVPADRWDIDDYFDPDPEAPGKMYTRHGGFLERVDLFDPQFFSISPREAASLDPQQRLLLEVVWEALENANQASERLMGSQTGVFIGITGFDYIRSHLSANPERIDAYFGTGVTHSAAAGRLSYIMGLTGPSMSVDTACSSSLVTAHLACQSLRQGECDMALVGGVNILLVPEVTINFSKAGMMSPDGRCKTFDQSANGYVRGEGCGVLVLKRLSDALADGDNIAALIRGSAVNQDGPSGGLTVPNGPSQQRVIQQALANGDVKAEDISLLEAHGTGTSLGDPIEVESLGVVFGPNHSPDKPLWLGSVKTNIGHLEGAAGVASLIKVILALQHKEIPPLVHFREPNAHINWDLLPFSIPTTLVPWTVDEGKTRVAGVSSFGFSGTNAHVILEEAPKQEKRLGDVERPVHLLTLSAKKAEALEQLAKRYKEHLAATPNLEASDVCFTANTGRSHFHHRLGIVAASTDEIDEKLADWLAQRPGRGIFSGQIRRDIGQPKVAFLFTGQGSQYTGMGKMLYETNPRFRQTLDRCDEILHPYLERPLLDVLYPVHDEDKALIHQTAYTQPALFALEYALARLWQSWQIQPSLVAGHSIGEYVAACIAGALSMEDGLKLVAARGKLMQALPAGGAMAAVFTNEARVMAMLQSWPGQISIAAVNSPRGIVISGEKEAVNQVVADLEADGISAQLLQVSHAFHSSLMDPILAAFTEVAAEISWRPLRIPMLSNITGDILPRGHVLDAVYWRRHTREAVRFMDGVKTLHDQQYQIFLEVGPKPTLLALVKQCWPDSDDSGLWLHSLAKGQADWRTLLESLACLYTKGLNVDWSAFDEEYVRNPVTLPTYPFQRKRYWLQGEDMQMDTKKSKTRTSTGQTKKHIAPKSKRQETILSIIRSKVVELLPLEPSEIVSDVSLMELGADSLILLEAMRMIEHTFGLRITVRQLVEELTTLDAIVTYLDEQLPSSWTAPAVTATVTGARPTNFELKNCFYKMVWESQPLPALSGLRPTGPWLILADNQGVGSQLAALLNARGQSSTVISAEQMETVLEQELTAGSGRLPDIVYLQGLDHTPFAETTLPILEQELSSTLNKALSIIQRVVGVETNPLPRLWLITQGAQFMDVDKTAPNLTQAPLWGLGRTCAVEHPELWGGVIDLDPFASIETCATQLLDVLLSGTSEDQIVLRHDRCYLARLIHTEPPAPQPVSIYSDASYLITGGLKGVGFEVSHWLARKGARYLILVGRTPLPARQEWSRLADDHPAAHLVHRVRELETLGVNVYYQSMDVAHETAVSNLLQALNQTDFPAIRGLVHCASVWQDEQGQSLIRTLSNLDHLAVNAVMRPKVFGSWLLYTYLDRPLLDFSIFFSSAASLAGSAGQGNYAAANAFLDALAHQMQAEGHSAISINWGAISGTGFGATSEGLYIHERWEDRGVGRIPVGQVLEALEYLAAGQTVQTGVMNMNWELIQRTYPHIGQAPWATNLLGDAQEQADDSTAAPVAPRAALASEQSSPSRRLVIQKKITSVVADLLQLPVSEMDIHMPFLEMGADSIILVDATRLIENTYGLKIAIRQLFEELTTIEMMAAYIEQNLPPGWVDPDAPQPKTMPKAENNQPKAAIADPRPEPVRLPQQMVVPAAPVTNSSQQTGQQVEPIETAVGETAVERILQGQLQLMSQQLETLQRVGGAAGQPNSRGRQPALPATSGTSMPGSSLPSPQPAPPSNSSNHQAAPVKTSPQNTSSAPSIPLPPWRVAEIRARGLSSRQQRHLEALIERYTERTQKSKEYAKKYRPVLTDNRASAGFRFSTKEMLYPIVGANSQGSRIWDIDDNEYIDITMGFGVHFFGHNPPFIAEAMETQFRKGSQLGPQADLAGEVARLICELTGMERAAFCNSGTEAVMTAIRLARATTGRHKIAMFTGSYHGHFDGTLGIAQAGNDDPRAVPIAPGTPPSMLADVLVLDYAQPQSLDILRAHAHELAGILVEPVQSRRPNLQPGEFLHQLRELTRQTGSTLIFDEMITGFRIHPGGAQAWFGIEADLATYGKIVGAGMPIGVVAGQAAYMDSLDGGQWQYGDASYPQVDTTFFAGTFCKHPLTMAAAHAALQHLKAHSPALQKQVNQRTERLAQTLNAFFDAEDVPIEVVYFGSMFRFAFKRNLDLLFYHLLEKGVFIWEGRNYFLSTAHTDEEVDYLIQAVKDSVEELRAGDFLPGDTAAIDVDAPLKAISRPFPATPQKITPPPQNGAHAAKSKDKAFWGWRQPKQAGKFSSKSRTLDVIATAGDRTDVQFSLFYFGSYEAAYEEGKYDLLIRGARFADRHGFTAVWAPERHFHAFGGFSPNPSLISAALARETKRIHLRAGSVVSPLHHPIRIAEEWSVVDNLSQGRVGVSFASGWHPNDFVFAPEAFGNHRELMFEGIDIVQALWQGKPVSVPGGAGNDVDVKIFPAPVQPELPIWITIVNNPDTYVRAGEMGAGVLTNLMGQSIEDLAKNIKLYRQSLARNGYDPEAGHVTALLHTFVGEDLEQVREQARQPFYNYMLSSIGIFKSLVKSQGLDIDLDRMIDDDDDREFLLSMAYDRYVQTTALIGTPASCSPIIDNLVKIGVDEIACFIDFGLETEQVLDNLPHLNQLRKQYENRKQREPVTIVPVQEAEPHTNGRSLQPGKEAVVTAPLTEGQKQLWVLSHMDDEGSLAGYPSFAIQLKGPFQLEAARLALQTVVNRHEALRTIIDRDGMFQQILPTLKIEIPLIDFSDHTGPEQEAVIDAWFEQDSQLPFNLTTGPLIRMSILRLEPENHVLIVTTHHIINDGFSIGIMLQEISELYSAACQGQEPKLETPMQFREYIEAFRQLEVSGGLIESEAHWLEKFSDFVPTLNLPTDRPRPRIKTFTGGRYTSWIDADFGREISQTSGKQGCTLLMVLLAAYMTLLHRLTEQDSIVVGIPAAVRPFEKSDSLVGYCTNLLPILSQINGHASFAAYLKWFRGGLLEDYEHLAYPIVKMTEKLNLWRDISSSPFVSAIFNLERRIPNPKMFNLETKWFSQPISSAGFELDLNITRIENGKLVLEWNYNKDLFDNETIERWDKYYHALLAGIVANPEQAIADLPMLTDGEREQLLVTWNQTETDYPQESCLHQLIAAQAEKTPEAVAIAYQEQQLTYLDLDQHANQLAHHLHSLGVGAETAVGVCLPRTPQLLVALLAVLKAGGAYVPLDPDYPQERLHYMLADSQAQVLLTTAAFQSRLSDFSGGVVCLDTQEKELADYQKEAPLCEITPNHLAYIIYTSGSTGQPKGTMISHQGLVNYLSWCSHAYAVAEGNGSLVHSSIGFDATITSLFAPLLVGKRVRLLPEEGDIEALAAALSGSKGYGLVKITPAHLEILSQLLPSAQLEHNTAFVIGGEALMGQNLWFWQQAMPQARLVNEYGPTETVVGCCVYEVPAGAEIAGAVPIGRPIANTELYVLDKSLQPVPVGVPGELYIGGGGVARGYLNQPGLTAEKFVPDPFSPRPGARLYRTGDVVVYLRDGNIKFLGRVDNQVKIRGFRVELGEVESILTGHPAVRETVVIAREDRPGDKQLVAYCVPEGEITLVPKELHAFLRDCLPDYMLPSAFVSLETLPLTVNGKIDREALPVPDKSASGVIEEYVSPSTPTEEVLVEIWSEVLGMSKIGIHDNFFALGGHSLLATQIISRVRDTFQVELPLRSIFETYTIAEMAVVIAAEQVSQAEEDTLQQILAEVAELSDDEVMEQLLEETK